MNDPCRRMVFCDFDGTITLNETFRKVLHALRACTRTGNHAAIGRRHHYAA